MTCRTKIADAKNLFMRKKNNNANYKSWEKWKPSKRAISSSISFSITTEKLQLLQYLAVNYAIFETCLNVIARLEFDEWNQTY